MPELPEVQTVVARLDGALRGAVIEAVRLTRRDVVRHGARDLGRRLAERRVERIDRHGKQIVWHLGDGLELRVHLGMTGNLVLAPRDLSAAPHTHVRIRFRDRPDEVRFVDPRRFGGLWLQGLGSRTGRFSVPLGPDALSIGPEAFRRLMSRDRQVKALLLDQSAIAGLGNIYVDESLHRAGIHPCRRASDVDGDGVRRLRAAIRRVLRSAIAAGGSTLRDYRDPDGASGWFQVRHRVYGREGEPCRGCREPIVRTVVASRSTHHCPRCQRST